MIKFKTLAAASFAIAALIPGAVSAQAPAEKPMKLTAQDYIDIKQLVARYAFAIEHCTNSGYTYADLYTEDGAFSSTGGWDVVPKRWSTGRDALAKAAGGGPDGCLPPKQYLGYGISHALVDLVITPTPTGAVGRVYLLTVGVQTQTTAELQGGYSDVYTKTPKGWRFQSRIHVIPDRAHSVQFGPGYKQYQGPDFR